MSWRRFLAQSSEMTHLSWFADPLGPGQFLVRDPNPQAPVLRHRGNGSLRARSHFGVSPIGRGASARASSEITHFLGGSQGALSPCLHGASHVRTRPATD